jgi:hypothetical protein
MDYFNTEGVCRRNVGLQEVEAGGEGVQREMGRGWMKVRDEMASMIMKAS